MLASRPFATPFIQRGCYLTGSSIASNKVCVSFTLTSQPSVAAFLEKRILYQLRRHKFYRHFIDVIDTFLMMGDKILAYPNEHNEVQHAREMLSSKFQ